MVQEGMQLAGRGVKIVAGVWGMISIYRGSVKYKWQT